jgi:hypothetical protein
VLNVLRIVISTWPSILFSLLIVFVDWEQIRGSKFPDIPNYVHKIDAIRWIGVDYFYLGETWIDYLKNEYVWFLVLYLIAKSYLDPFLALKIISAFSAFVYHRFLAAGIGNVLASIFLLNPITIDLLSSQLRGAFAFSFFLVAVMLLRRRIMFYGAVPLLGFVHSAMFVFGCLFFASSWFANIRRLNAQYKVFIVAVLAVGFAFLIAFIAPLILSAIGDRRSFDEADNKSTLYVAFWLIWGVMLVVSIRPNMEINWAYLFAIAICVSVPVMTIFGFPGFRLLALSLPVILLSLTKLPTPWQFLAGVGMILYQVVLFTYWIV